MCYVCKYIIIGAGLVRIDAVLCDGRLLRLDQLFWLDAAAATELPAIDANGPQCAD